MSDSSNFQSVNNLIKQLHRSDTFDYDGRTWEIQKAYSYDWNDGYFSDEYEVSNGSDSCYLCIDEDDEMLLSWVNDVPLSELPFDVKDKIKRNRQPPETFRYQGIEFRLSEESKGYFIGEYGERERLTNWDYEDATENYLFSVEQWSDHSIETFFGKYITPSDISNIQKKSTQKGSAFIRKNPGSGSVSWLIFAAIAFAVILFNAIFRGKQSSDYVERPPIEQEGLDFVISNYALEPNLTVLLNDMDFDGNVGKHQYKVIVRNVDSTFREEISSWVKVSPAFFLQHENDLGMEVASKVNGRLTKAVAPAGYSQYVGNSAYGTWEEADTTKSWRFHRRYRHLDNHFHIRYRTAYYQHYDDYDRNYRSSGRSYHGPNSYYGTSNYGKTTAGGQTTWIKRNPTFRQQARNYLVRAKNSINRTSRNSSRYSKNPSRSRSRSFGGK